MSRNRKVGWGLGRSTAVQVESPAKKAKKRKVRRKDEDLEKLADKVAAGPSSKPEPETVEGHAEVLGIDLSVECPVCRSLESCECEEEDRTFVHRTRFWDDLKKVPRCRRDSCGAPLSVLYMPRPGTRPPHRLAQFTALWVCSVCNAVALATAAISTGRSRP